MFVRFVIGDARRVILRLCILDSWHLRCCASDIRFLPAFRCRSFDHLHSNLGFSTSYAQAQSTWRNLPNFGRKRGRAPIACGACACACHKTRDSFTLLMKKTEHNRTGSNERGKEYINLVQPCNGDSRTLSMEGRDGALLFIQAHRS